MTILPPEILCKILAIFFPDPHPSPFSTLSTALQLSSQTLRAITLEILWTRVEFDGPLDPRTRLISRDHIRHIVCAILIKGMEKSWSTTIWRTLLSLLQSIPNLHKVFFEQIGTGTYSIDHLRTITPTQQEVDLPGWDILTFYEDQQIHTTDSFLMPWSILDWLMCTSLITHICSLDISSNHGALEIDLMVYSSSTACYFINSKHSPFVVSQKDTSPESSYICTHSPNNRLGGGYAAAPPPPIYGPSAPVFQKIKYRWLCTSHLSYVIGGCAPQPPHPWAGFRFPSLFLEKSPCLLWKK